MVAAIPMTYDKDLRVTIHELASFGDDKLGAKKRRNEWTESREKGKMNRIEALSGSLGKLNSRRLRSNISLKVQGVPLYFYGSLHVGDGGLHVGQVLFLENKNRFRDRFPKMTSGVP